MNLKEINYCLLCESVLKHRNSFNSRPIFWDLVILVEVYNSEKDHVIKGDYLYTEMKSLHNLSFEESKSRNITL